VLIELFLLGVTTETLRANDWKSAILFEEVGQFRPKFEAEGDVHHQPFFARLDRSMNAVQPCQY